MSNELNELKDRVALLEEVLKILIFKDANQANGIGLAMMLDDYLEGKRKDGYPINSSIEDVIQNAIRSKSDIEKIIQKVITKGHGTEKST